MIYRRATKNKLSCSIRSAKQEYKVGESIEIEFLLANPTGRGGAGAGDPEVYVGYNQVLVTDFIIRGEAGEERRLGCGSGEHQTDYANVWLNMDWPPKKGDNTDTCILHPGQFWGCVYRLNPFECPPGGMDGKTQFACVEMEYYLRHSRVDLTPGTYQITAEWKFNDYKIQSNAITVRVVRTEEEEAGAGEST